MSKGKFDSRQAATLINAIGPMSHRPEVIQILAPRLCQMTCADAREILLAVNVNSDHRLNALNHIKRFHERFRFFVESSSGVDEESKTFVKPVKSVYLSDNQTALGREYILSVFPYETSKRKALQILSTANSGPETAYPSGGHQIHAPLGTVVSQAVPLKEYYYGPISEQIAKTKSPPSPAAFWSCLPERRLQNLAHASYTYPEDHTYTHSNGTISLHQYSAPKYNHNMIRNEIAGFRICGSSAEASAMAFPNIQRNVYPVGADYIC